METRQQLINYAEFDYSACADPNVIYTFDCETSSYWMLKNDYLSDDAAIPAGTVTGYDPRIDSDFYNSQCEPGAVVYIWMIGINDRVIYSRELSDLPDCLARIRDAAGDNGLIMWVHNLSYDFQFLRSVLHFSDVFARQVRKPIKCSAAGFTWRCSYMLTRLSLDAWGKSLRNTDIRKQSGSLDYDVLRTPMTQLSDTELTYCICDIIVMYYGLCEYVKKYGSQDKIPLTQTGEVRAVVKKMFSKDNGHRFRVTEMQPGNVDEYIRLRSCFAGGDCHANKNKACVVHKNVGSFDKTSDYPYQMCAMQYPSTAFRRCSSDLTMLDTDKYAYILYLQLINPRCVTQCTYISRSHCIAVQRGEYDNGRVLRADQIVLSCTEQDYLTIRDTYKCDSIVCIKAFKSRKKYLPKKYIEYILELYDNKTRLKGVAGAEDLYAQSKQFINSLYGMMVTDILMQDIEYDGQWIRPEQITDDIVNAKLADIKKRWFANNLAYQWGVWVTAYARRELWETIIHVGDDVVYYDTDSCKMLHPDQYTDFFRACDAVMDDRLRLMCDHYDIDFERTRPQKPNGAPAPLGHWDFEGVYKRFRTNGAKRYAYSYGDDKIHITVAGVPKQAACCVTSLKDFDNGFTFDREHCGKKLHIYLDNCNLQCALPDGYVVRHAYSICMRKTEYTMGYDDYLDLVRAIDHKKGIFNFEVV